MRKEAQIIYLFASDDQARQKPSPLYKKCHPIYVSPMRVIIISTATTLFVAPLVHAKTIESKIINQENWKERTSSICPRANTSRLKPVIFSKDYKIKYGDPYRIDEGNVIQPRKIEADGSVIRAHVKNISIGEIGIKQDRAPLPQLIAFLNNDGELVTEDGKLVTEANPVKRYPLSSKMLNFVGDGEELVETYNTTIPGPNSYEKEERLLGKSKNCSYLQTNPQIHAESSVWRRFNARYVCGGNLLQGYSLRVDTSLYTRTNQTKIRSRMLFMKDHEGRISKGPLDNLAKQFSSLSGECDWSEVKIN